MSEFLNNSFWVFISFFVAICLHLIPINPEYSWLAPNWTVLFLVYWVIFFGNKVGIITGFSLGIFIDILDGLTLGTMGLTLAVTVFLATILRNKMRLAQIWQHFLIVFFIVASANLVRMWLQMVNKNLPESYSFWGVTLTTMLCWPIVTKILKTYHKLTIAKL